MNASRFAQLRGRWDLFALGLGTGVLACGLAMGRWGGAKEALDLRVGATVDRLSPAQPLPFRVRLEAMAVDAPPAPPKVLIRRGETEFALDPKEGVGCGDGHVKATVVKVLPNAVPDFGFRETAQGPDSPVVHLMLGLGTPVPLEGYLVAKDPTRLRFDEPGGRFAVVSAEGWDPAMLRALRARPGRLVFSFGGRELEHPATPGIWVFPSFDLNILEVFPDLGLDTAANGQPKAFHRSRMPRNPWVLVRLTQKDGEAADLLVAANPPELPAYKAALAAALPPGADLRYDRQGEELQHRFVVLTTDGAARLVEDGHLVKTEPLPPGRPFVVAKGLSVTVLERFARAEPVEAYAVAREGEAMTSAVQVRVDGPAPEIRWLGLERPEIQIPEAKVRLRFGAPMPPLEAVRARITVLNAAGATLAQRTLTGNETLEVEGHTLRLGRGASLDGRWCQVAVSKDPGRWPLILGAVLLGLGGLLFLQRRRAAAPAKGD